MREPMLGFAEYDTHCEHCAASIVNARKRNQPPTNMSLELPYDKAVLERRAAIATDLRRLLPSEAVICDEVGLGPYESDALTAYRQLPLVAALPATTAEVAAVLR